MRQWTSVFYLVWIGLVACLLQGADLRAWSQIVEPSPQPPTSSSFASPHAEPASPLTAHLQQDAYPLGAGDVLDIRDGIMGDLLLNGHILPDGTLTLPLIGKLHLAGLSAAQAKDLLRERYTHYFSDPQLTLRVVRQHPARVYVTGAVTNPGVYVSGKNLQPDALAQTTLGRTNKQSDFYRLYLTDALMLSGGLNTTANVRDIRIHRNVPQPATLHVNLMDVLSRGDTAQDLVLHDQDVVEVEALPQELLLQPDIATALSDSNLVQAHFNISVLGAVAKPGLYELNRGETVLDALAKAGGLTSVASRRRIFVLHTTPQGQVVKRELNLQDKKLAGKKPVTEWAALLPQDVVFVDESETKKAAKFGLNLAVDRAASAALFPVFNALFFH